MTPCPFFYDRQIIVSSATLFSAFLSFALHSIEWIPDVKFKWPFSENEPLNSLIMKFLIADDYWAVRKGLIQIIEEEFPLVSIVEVSTGDEALEQLRKNAFHIAILDINMPGINGLDVVRMAKAESVSTPMLVLTALPEEQYALRVLKAGAAGFIGKEAASEELAAAIRKILSGRKYITESVSEKLAGGLLSDPSKSLHELLSAREYEIMVLLASGQTVSQISAQLSIAVPTVSTYRGRIFEKMHFRNNAELMQYVISSGIA